MANEKVSSKTVDETVEFLEKEVKETTNPKHPEKMKYKTNVDTMRKIMENQGVDRESLDKMGSAIDVAGRAFHHFGSKKIKEGILKHKHDKELISKISASVSGDLIPSCMRLTVEVNGERRGMTIPHGDVPSKEYVTYGTSKSVIEINSCLNEQRKADSEMIKEAYEKLNK